MITPRKPSIRNTAGKEKSHNASLAHKILESKTRVDYYEVSGTLWWGEDDYTDAYSYTPLSLDEMDTLAKLLDDEENAGIALYELEEDIPFYDKLSEDGFVPEAIDLLHPVHYYAFTAILHIHNNDTNRRCKFQVCLSDDEYLALLQWRLGNRYDSFNMLSDFSPQLFVRLTKRFINALGDKFGPCFFPFLILTDEVDEDVLREVGEPDFYEHLYEDLSPEKGNPGCVYLSVSERILRLCFQKYPTNEENGVTGVDAVAVQNALGASNYNELFQKVKERFGKCVEAVDRFKDFLDSGGIAYQLV